MDTCLTKREFSFYWRKIHNKGPPTSRLTEASQYPLPLSLLQSVHEYNLNEVWVRNEQKIFEIRRSVIICHHQNLTEEQEKKKKLDRPVDGVH